MVLVVAPEHGYAAAIGEANAFLTESQQPDGSWTSDKARTVHATVAALGALQATNSGAAARSAGADFLEQTPAADADAVARRVDALAGEARDVAPDLDALLAASDPLGGWGLLSEFSADPLDSALALIAVARGGSWGAPEVGPALGFLVSRQASDGGWACVEPAGSLNDSDVSCTAQALLALGAYRGIFNLELAITGAKGFLIANLEPDGSIGGVAADPVYTTGLAVRALRAIGDDLGTARPDVIAFFEGRQEADGSWGGDPLLAAVALRALVSLAPAFTSVPVTSAQVSRDYVYNATTDLAEQILSFSLVVHPEGMTMDPETGLIEWTPEAGQEGDHTVTVRVLDINGLIRDQTFVVTVDEAAANSPPFITSLPPLVATATKPYRYDVEATDFDVADTLSFSLPVAPDGMLIDATTGIVEWAPMLVDVGAHDVMVRVEDVLGASDEQDFRVVVNAEQAGGVIIVNNDEWTLSNYGFSQTPESAQFAINVAALFTGGTGSLHAYSTNFGFTESALRNTLEGAGHTYTTGVGIPFDLATLSAFDGIFLGGDLLNSEEIEILAEYVNAGGNVYLAAGTSSGNPGGVANAWNLFLQRFGLSFDSVNNGITGNIDVSGSDHPIFLGVTQLYQQNGQTITGEGIEVFFNGQGLYAVIDTRLVTKPDATIANVDTAGLFFDGQELTVSGDVSANVTVSGPICSDGACCDGIWNGDEEFIDCGGSCLVPCCPPCTQSSDCGEGLCHDGRCQPSTLAGTTEVDVAGGQRITAYVGCDGSLLLAHYGLGGRISGYDPAIAQFSDSDGGGIPPTDWYPTLDDEALGHLPIASLFDPFERDVSMTCGLGPSAVEAFVSSNSLFTSFESATYGTEGDFGSPGWAMIAASDSGYGRSSHASCGISLGTGNGGIAYCSGPGGPWDWGNHLTSYYSTSAANSPFLGCNGDGSDGPSSEHHLWVWLELQKSDNPVRPAGIDLASVIPFEVLFFEDRNADGVYDSSSDQPLGGTTITELPAVGEPFDITAPLSGPVLFSENLVWGFVDSQDEIDESNEMNNFAHSGELCRVAAQPQIDAIGYWRFEEGSPDTEAIGSEIILDLSEFSDHGSAYGGPTYRSDVPVSVIPRSGQENHLSLQFDDSDEILFDSVFPFHLPGDVTLEFWLKFVPTSHQSVFWTERLIVDRNRFNIFVNSNGTFGFDYRNPSGTLRYVIGALGSGVLLPTEAWTHLAITREGNEYHLFVDGSPAASAVDAFGDLPTSTGWTIGGRPANRYLGFIDEVRLSDGALSPSEFLNAEGTAWVPAPDLTASYLRVTRIAGGLVITARVGNGGAATAAPGVQVAFYDGNPALGRLLGTASTTEPLRPGEFSDVTLTLLGTTETMETIWVVADDGGDGTGLLDECDEANNVYDSGLQILRPPIEPIPDADGDGFSEDSDCDDADAAVNPGADEIPGNGLDDDCNPGTPDQIPAEDLTCIVRTDRVAYGANEDILASVVLSRSGGQGSLAGLELDVRVEDSLGALIGDAASALPPLAPGERREQSFFIPTGITPPGPILVAAEVLAGAEVVASCATESSIASSLDQGVSLIGSIVADPPVANTSREVVLRYDVQNAGNVPVDPANLDILVVRPSGEVAAELSDSASLAVGASFEAEQSIPVRLAAGDYIVILRGGAGDERQTLASASLRIEAIAVDVDIKPGSCPNPWNRKSKGVLPVALVGSPGFDVTQVDLSSVVMFRADGVGGSVEPNEGPPGPHSVVEDVATPFEGETCSCHELGADGEPDLSMKFRTEAAVLALELADSPPGDLVELIVSGTLLDGTPFEGSDCVRLVPPGTPPGRLLVQTKAADVWTSVSPLDDQLDGGGFGSFERTYPLSTEVTLTASREHGDGVFLRWQLDGDTIIKNPTVSLVIAGTEHTAEVVYKKTTSCGLGFELVFLVPPLMWLHQRRRRRAR